MMGVDNQGFTIENPGSITCMLLVNPKTSSPFNNIHVGTIFLLKRSYVSICMYQWFGLSQL